MPVTGSDVTRAVSAKKVTVFSVAKATAQTGAGIAYFDKPAEILDIKCIIGTAFVTGGFTAGQQEIGISSDADYFAENTTVTTTDASGTNIAFSIANTIIPGGTWMLLTFPAAAGAGTFSITITYREIEIE